MLMWACDDAQTDGGSTSSGASGGGGTAASGGSGGSGGGGGSGGSGGQDGGGGDGLCEPLSAPTGNVVLVDTSQTGQLQSIVSSAAAGDTIALADGTYDLNGAYLWISAAGVTIRSQSGNREAVILDGGYSTTEIITVKASDVTIADLTLRRAYTHPIHVANAAGADSHNTLIYNVHVIDPRQQAIKINSDEPGWYADDGVVACSHIELTAQGRPLIDPGGGGCYTGGIDAHKARGWVVRDNRIEGFWCDSGLAEHAVHFWTGSRDTLVQRNVLVNNARGVGFGLTVSAAARTYGDDPCPAAAGNYVGHYDGIVRNNFVVANEPALLASGSGFDCGICLWHACGARVVHNSVVSSGDNFSSIEWRYIGSTGIQVSNNIATHALRERDSASATLEKNLENAELSLFVDVNGGDLHLQAGANAAIDQGAPLDAGLCDDDIDGDARDSQPDIGADEIP